MREEIEKLAEKLLKVVYNEKLNGKTFEPEFKKVLSEHYHIPTKSPSLVSEEEVKLRAEEFWQLFRMIRNTVSDENGYVLETAFKKTVETFFIRPHYLDNFWNDYDNKVCDLVCDKILNYSGKGKFGGEKIQRIAEIVKNSTLIVKEGEKDSEDWISVSEKLPEPNVKAPSYRKGEMQYLCICNENGYLSEQLLNYGDFEFVDADGDFHDADEHGFVKRFGWSYERDSEGEYDSLVFDMNGKVVFWREIPNFKNRNTNPPKQEQQKTGNNG